MNSKTLSAIWWAVCAFLLGLTLTTQVLAYQERHTVAPMTSPLVSPLDHGKLTPTARIWFHHMNDSGGNNKKDESQSISQTPTPVPPLTATPLPILPETGGDLIDATE